MLIIVKSVDFNSPAAAELFVELLAGFDSVVPNLDARPLFVIMGPFCKPSRDLSVYRSAMRTLSSAISRFKNIASSAKFLLIPSLEENPCGTMLPQPPMPRMLMKEFEVRGGGREKKRGGRRRDRGGGGTEERFLLFRGENFVELGLFF